MNQFMKDISAFADALGYDHPAVVIQLAEVPWQSEDDRDTFINFLKSEAK